MRLLVTGLQSSGASTVTAFLAQRPDCVAVVDTINSFLVPPLRTPRPAVAKAVITTRYRLAEHQAVFRPDATLLVLRDPRANWVSLSSKPWATLSGTMEGKFARLEALVADPGAHGIDAMIRYEDLLARAPALEETLGALGWPPEPSWYDLPRTREAMLATLWEEAPETFTTHRDGFSFGNFQGRRLDPAFRDKVIPSEVTETVRRLCPRVLALYAPATA